MFTECYHYNIKWLQKHIYLIYKYNVHGYILCIDIHVL